MEMVRSGKDQSSKWTFTLFGMDETKSMLALCLMCIVAEVLLAFLNVLVAKLHRREDCECQSDEVLGTVDLVFKGMMLTILGVMAITCRYLVIPIMQPTSVSGGRDFFVPSKIV